MARTPVVMGPFSGGLNTFDDPTAVADNELVESINWDPGLDGSLWSRPPMGDTGYSLPAGSKHVKRIGTDIGSRNFWSNGRETLYWEGTSWVKVAPAMNVAITFNGVVWVTGPGGGGYIAGGVYTADPAMPIGTSMVEYKGRLFLSGVDGFPQRVYYSKTFAESNIWSVVNYFSVGAGDGQTVRALVAYYNSILIFRSDSIYTFSYSTAVAQGLVSALVPGIGLTSNEAYAVTEGSIYFTHRMRAYQFINNNVQLISAKVPLVEPTFTGLAPTFDYPEMVTAFGTRIIFFNRGRMAVYSTATRTWGTWETLADTVGQFVPSLDGTSAYVIERNNIDFAPVLHRNWLLNPRGQDGATDWAGSFSGGVAGTFDTTTTSQVEEGASLETTLRLTITTAGTGNAMFTPLVDVAALPGPWTFSGFLHQNSGVTKNGRVILRWLNSGGGVISDSTLNVSLATSTWTKAILNATAPALTQKVRVFVGVSDGMPLTTGVRASGMVLGEGNDNGEWFDGGRDVNANYRYQYTTFPLNLARTSIRTATIPCKAYRLVDRFAPDYVDVIPEDFTCVIRTKNYDLQLSSNFKRLFWWGVDAVLNQGVRGRAYPVAQASPAPPATFTGYGPSGELRRKFMKFAKSLRFRQIAFRVEIDTDGTPDQGPVNLFTLSAFVGTKETASTGIS